MKKDNLVYIEDIYQSTNKIISYVDGMEFEDFQEDSLTQDAVIRNFEIIGEASRKIDKDFAKETDFPVEQSIGMRNKLIHDYGEINLEVVWKTIEQDLPILLDLCEKILK